MKKGSLILLILVLISSIILTFRMHLTKEKPSNYFYTNSLAKNLTLCDNLEVTVLDTNFYKTEPLPKEDVELVKMFLKELRKPNFIQQSSIQTQKPEYKIFFTFKDTNEKYIINVYTNELVTIYPWDGDFTMDCVNMKNVHIRYNLYAICKNSFMKKPNI